jgi:hypothetical protein
MISRRTWLARTGGAALLVLAGRRSSAAALVTKPAITVWKDPGCGCCNAWVDHMRGAGFDVKTHDESGMDEVKGMMGVPAALRSCHTAQAGAYVIEGHVPASDVKRILAEKPKILGLAVPGMPMSAPGMAQPGARKVPYEVIAFEKGGVTKVFAKY